MTDTRHAQVTLKYLDPPTGQSDTEIVNAKFVLGADGQYTVCSARSKHAAHPTTGAHSWVRKALGITMDGEQTGAPTPT